MKILGETLFWIVNTILGLHFLFTGFASIENRSLVSPQHLVISFGVLWLITQIISWINYCDMEQKLEDKK